MVHYVVAHYAKVRFLMVHYVEAVNNLVFHDAVLTVVETAAAHLGSDLGGHNLAFQYVVDAHKYAVEAHHFDVADAHKYAVEASYFEVAAAHHFDVADAHKYVVEASRLFLADGHKSVLVGQPVA